MMNAKKLRDSSEAWDARELGADEQFAEQAPLSVDFDAQIDEALALRKIFPSSSALQFPNK